MLTCSLNAFAQTPEQLIDAGHWKRAAAALETALKANPSDAAALCQMSRLKLAFGDLDAAQKLAQKAVDISPSAATHFQLAMAYGETAAKASVFRQLGLVRSFRRELEAALKADPRHIPSHLMEMRFYWEAPGIMGGSKDKARAEAAAIGQIDAARGFLAQAEIAQNEKQTAAAIGELYRKAHDAGPSNYETAAPYCNYLARQKQWPALEGCARELIKIDAGTARGHVLLIFAYANQQRWPEVDNVLPEAEKKVPDNLTPYFQAGAVALRAGDGPRAERYFRKYLTQEPEKQAPSLANAHVCLAQALEKQGRKPEAIAELKTALQIDPRFEPAQKELKRMQS